MTAASPDDPALRLACRCLAFHRAALRHDRRTRQTEVALAHWARVHNLPLSRSTRSQHPRAQELRQQLRRAARSRRQRDRLLPTLAATPAVSVQGARAKLAVARLFIDDTPAATLLQSLTHDLRRLQ